MSISMSTFLVELHMVSILASGTVDFIFESLDESGEALAIVRGLRDGTTNL